METPQFKKYLKTLLKISFSCLAIWIVINQLDFKKLQETLNVISIGWLCLALSTFISSQFISSLRLNHLLKCIDINLTIWIGFKLYLKGMLYSLLLPGGIAGDGYKGIVLKKYFNVSTKRIATTLLIDRLLGLFALVFLALLLMFYLKTSSNWLALKWFIIPLVPFLYILIKLIFPTYINKFFLTITLSTLVQGLQLVTVFILLVSFGIQESISEYLILFLISSLVAVIPISIGGLGVRELTFIAGSEVLFIDQEVAVLIAFLFYIISTFTSLLGLFPVVELSNSDKTLVNQESS